jgi:hypothetical protein
VSAFLFSLQRTLPELLHLMWALLPVKPTASGFSDQVFLRLATFTPSSLPALFQGFWILTLISTLGSRGYSPVVHFWDLSAKMCVSCFLCYSISSTSCIPLLWALIPGKPMASGLTHQVFVILARFSSACHGLPSFWDSHPYLYWA